ncbi:uncharacterized protein LOC125202410 isoform X2 [Salvia hispanica]|uniref:uncharacterized protein LOC125202410 isoform X2 n=1 Tax=Salvia hispanica TaxID=49212 RepID=UPI0020095D97|nr:uncharacterized protein LOC125202410 isoform X2 [Salvia hispanica]
MPLQPREVIVYLNFVTPTGICDFKANPYVSGRRILGQSAHQPLFHILGQPCEYTMVSLLPLSESLVGLCRGGWDSSDVRNHSPPADCRFHEDRPLWNLPGFG